MIIMEKKIVGIIISAVKGKENSRDMGWDENI